MEKGEGAAGAAAEEDPEPGLGRGMAVLKSPWAPRLGREGRGAPAEGSEALCGAGEDAPGAAGTGTRAGTGMEMEMGMRGGKALAVNEQKHSWSATKC